MDARLTLNMCCKIFLSNVFIDLLQICIFYHCGSDVIVIITVK